MTQENKSGKEILLELLDILADKHWKDNTILKAIYLPKLWNKLIQDLEMNPDMSEEYFLELMEDFD